MLKLSKFYRHINSPWILIRKIFKESTYPKIGLPKLTPAQGTAAPPSFVHTLLAEPRGIVEAGNCGSASGSGARGFLIWLVIWLFIGSTTLLFAPSSGKTSNPNSISFPPSVGIRTTLLMGLPTWNMKDFILFSELSLELSFQTQKNWNFTIETFHHIRLLTTCFYESPILILEFSNQLERVLFCCCFFLKK